MFSIERYSMQNCSPLSCPMDPNSKLSLDDDSPEVDATLYRQLIGSLLYLAGTHPDLFYAMSILSQFSSHPRRSHWQAAIRVLRYLRGTIDYGLHYSGGDVLIGYTDADWADCVDTRRSTIGYCFIIWFRSCFLEMPKATYYCQVFYGSGVSFLYGHYLGGTLASTSFGSFDDFSYIVYDDFFGLPECYCFST